MSSSPSSSGRKKKKRLPTFIPHVTLVGGISIAECCTVDDDVLPLLQQQPLPQQRQRDGANTWRDGVDDSADEKKEEDYVVEQQNDDDTLDEVAAKSVLIRLTNAFCNFGGVECNFVKERGVFAARRRKEEGGDNGNNKSNDNNNSEEEGGEVQWNQSCISIMERTDSFTRAVELADQVLLSPTTTTTRSTTTTTSSYNEHGHDKGHDQLALSPTSSFERHLKPPTCEPHYSFVYGNDASLISSLQPPPPSSSSSSSSNSSSNDVSSSAGGIMKKKNDDLVLQCPPDFTSTEIAVMWTYPSTLEGVEQWREIGRFSLVKEEEGVTQSKY